MSTQHRSRIVPCWHSHHVLPGHLGWVDPEVRHAEIDRCKPKRERAKRHAMLKPVAGELPAEVVAAGDARARAGDPRAGYALILARGAYRRAIKAHRPEIEALHAAECGCGLAWGEAMTFEGGEEGELDELE